MSLSNVPGDIHRYIAELSGTSGYQNLIRSSRLFRTNLESEYLKRICELPIQPQEFLQYLSSNPPRIGNLSISPISAEGYVRQREGDNYHTILRCIARQGNIDCFTTNDIVPITYVHRIFKLRGYNSNIFDLFTTGNILLRRRNCNRQFPNYVRNKLLHLLSSMEIHPTDDLPTKLQKLLQLQINSTIFNVAPTLMSIRNYIDQWLPPI